MQGQGSFDKIKNTAKRRKLVSNITSDGARLSTARSRSICIDRAVSWFETGSLKFRSTNGMGRLAGLFGLLFSVRDCGNNSRL